MNEVREVSTDHAKSEGVAPEAYERYAMGAGPDTEPLDTNGEVDEGGSGGSDWRGRPLSEFHERYPREYIEPQAAPTDCPPFGDPADLAKTVNPKYPGERSEYPADDPFPEAARPYTVNCVDCSRAVEERWRGRLETAAGLQGPDASAVDGETFDRFDEWTGEAHQEVGDIEDVRQRLLDAGHGASVVIAVVGHEYGASAYESSGHAFNVVNYHGEVRVIDGQLGRDFDWAPGTAHPMFDSIGSASVHGWDVEGRALWSK